VDPGVTLLELYAWLFEQRVYWMDQVPDTLTRGLLTLLGVTPPLPAQVAQTVLFVTRIGDLSPAATPAPALLIPIASLVNPAKGLNPPVFTTTSAFTFYPL